jgi:branched-chain amino acid transport system substrate-binding protein
MGTRAKVLAVAGVLLAVGLVTPHAGSFVILLVTRALVLAIVAMSLDILLGFTGLASLGQAAYLGVGAYLTGILATRYNFGLGSGFWLVIIMGALLGAATAAFFGLFAIRATGVYFLMITLALGQCVWGLAYRWNSLTGGDNGINLPGRPQFGLNLADDVTYFYVVFGFMVASLLSMYVLVNSPFGRSLEGIREREVRMRVLGYNTWLHKYLAFVIAGGFGGLAGVLWAHANGHVSPEDVVLTTSVDALLMVVLGGSGTLVGGAIGAWLVVFLREYLSTLVPWWQYALGGVYVLTIFYVPGGLISMPQRIRHWRAGAPEPAMPKEGVSVVTRKSAGIGLTLMGGCIALATNLAAGPGARAQTLPDPERQLIIGHIGPMTGPFAQVGKDMINGFEMYSDEVKGDFGGAKVKFIQEDDQAKPPTSVLKAEKLIRQDKVHILLGGVLASTGYAVAPVSTREKTVYILSVAAADDLTQREIAKYPYIIRTGWTSSQPTHPFGEWACAQGYRRIAVVSADYAFGYETVGGFQKTFEECGGKIIQKIWPPLGTIDFGPYIPTIKQDADAIFTLMVGPMSLQFPKQLAAAGNKKPVIGGGTSYDEFTLPSMGDEVIGHVSVLQYSAALDTPKNAAFVKKYREKYGKVPSYFSETNYTTAQMIDAVMKQNGGKWPGAEQFVKQLASLKVDAVRGPVSFDEMRNPIQNIYVKKVERTKMFGYGKDELWNTVIKTYPNVSQFWKYGKDAFLKQPVYSRDFPPCGFCE